MAGFPFEFRARCEKFPDVSTNKSSTDTFQKTMSICHIDRVVGMCPRLKAANMTVNRCITEYKSSPPKVNYSVRIPCNY